jgi:hypothetical protein
MQVSKIGPSGEYYPVRRIVTRKNGSWKYQQAFGFSKYAPCPRVRGGGYYWRSINSCGKFARTQRTADDFTQWRIGSLHLKPARHVVDDFGNIVFVCE